MTTRQTIDNYFTALKTGDRWQDHLADHVELINLGATPVEHVTGRNAYVESTQGFYALAKSVDVQEIIIDGNRACVLTLYHLQPPVGETFTSNIAEVFTVDDDKIQSLAIYFDSAPFPTPPPPEPQTPTSDPTSREPQSRLGEDSRGL